MMLITKYLIFYNIQAKIQPPQAVLFYWMLEEHNRLKLKVPKLRYGAYSKRGDSSIFRMPRCGPNALPQKLDIVSAVSSLYLNNLSS